jgi:hypothetical protein
LNFLCVRPNPLDILDVKSCGDLSMLSGKSALEDQEDANVDRLSRVIDTRLCFEHGLIFHGLVEAALIVVAISVRSSRLNLHADPDSLGLEHNIDRISGTQDEFGLLEPTFLWYAADLGMSENEVLQSFMRLGFATTPATRTLAAFLRTGLRRAERQIGQS